VHRVGADEHHVGAGILQTTGVGREQVGSIVPPVLALHPADLGTDVASEELDASIATRRSAEIAEIDAALDRMATSPETFGYDEQSGEEIAFERLEIIPYARTNVAL
jgi:RNA polymerase-binding transcription factor DksA